MKKLLAFVITGFIFGAVALTSVSAAPTPVPSENVIIDLYKQQQELSEVETETETKDNLKQTDMASYSSLLSAYRKMYGMDLIPDYDPAKVELLEKRPYLRYGLVQYSTQTMVNAFYWGPSANIPQQYAEMFLPKKMLESSGTAFAVGSPPDASNSARTYLGYLGLNKLWGVTFSIAMAILVIILIVAGFMIMFRSKAGGQVVVTVSMALQNAVIGALLALASYAIGAFFLNLSKYLVLMIGALFATAVYDGAGDNVIYINGPGQMISVFWNTLAWGSMAKDLTTWLVATQEGLAKDAMEWGILGGPFWKLIGKATSFSIVSIIAKLVIGGAMAIVAIRIFWTVLTTYVKMIIDIIIAPILFMFSSLPGKQAGFTTWLSRMFKNAIAVPLMFAFVNVAGYMAFVVSAATDTCMTENTSIITCVTGGLIPGGITAGTDTLLMAVGPSAVIALVLLNMVPQVPVMVNEMFSAKGGDFSKAWEGTKKSLQSMPAIGSFFQ